MLTLWRLRRRATPRRDQFTRPGQRTDDQVGWMPMTICEKFCSTFGTDAARNPSSSRVATGNRETPPAQVSSAGSKRFDSARPKQRLSLQYLGLRPKESTSWAARGLIASSLGRGVFAHAVILAECEKRVDRREPLVWRRRQGYVRASRIARAADRERLSRRAWSSAEGSRFVEIDSPGGPAIKARAAQRAVLGPPRSMERVRDQRRVVCRPLVNSSERCHAKIASGCHQARGATCCRKEAAGAA